VQARVSPPFAKVSVKGEMQLLFGALEVPQHRSEDSCMVFLGSGFILSASGPAEVVGGLMQFFNELTTRHP
jgi:hypothetical protein